MEKVKKFVKEHKLLVGACAVAIVLVIALLIIFVPRGSSPTDEDYLSGIGTAPDDTSDKSSTDDSDIIDFPDDSESDTDVSTSNPDEDENVDNSESNTTPDENDDKSDSSTEPTTPDNSSSDTKEPTNNTDDDEKEPTHTCSYTTLKSDSSNHWYVCSCGKTANKSAHNYSSEADTTCDTCGYTREVTTEESTIPSVSWTGTPITLPTIGVSIVTLKDFNDEALTDNTNNTHWYGNTADTETGQVLSDTLNAVRDTVISKGVINSTDQGFAVEQYQIAWAWGSYSSTMDYALKRDPLTKTYTLELNLPFDSYVSSWGVDVTAYNQDIIRTLISCFSSNVETVYAKIYQDVYGDVCISDTGWTTVGDCKIQYDDANSSLNHFVYKIKAK